MLVSSLLDDQRHLILIKSHLLDAKLTLSLCRSKTRSKNQIHLSLVFTDDFIHGEPQSSSLSSHFTVHKHVFLAHYSIFLVSFHSVCVMCLIRLHEVNTIVSVLMCCTCQVDRSNMDFNISSWKSKRITPDLFLHLVKNVKCFCICHDLYEQFHVFFLDSSSSQFI